MYLWKSWHNARIAVMIYALPILLEIYSIFEFLRRPPQHMDSGAAWSPFGVMISLAFLGATMPLVAWIIGGDGIGRDIAEDSGAFVLTRPRSRRFFLWFDSGFSLGLMALMAVGALLNYELVRLSNILPMPAAGPLASILIVFSGLIFVGLIYSVTYLCTMVVPRHGTARVVSVVVLLSCAYLHHKSHVWGGITPYLFPSWLVNPFPDAHSAVAAPHVWLELGVRVIAIVVLLLAAQFVLERREIRA
jgi:hypothetical protein